MPRRIAFPARRSCARAAGRGRTATHPHGCNRHGGSTRFRCRRIGERMWREKLPEIEEQRQRWQRLRDRAGGGPDVAKRSPREQQHQPEAPSILAAVADCVRIRFQLPERRA